MNKVSETDLIHVFGVITLKCLGHISRSRITGPYHTAGYQVVLADTIKHSPKWLCQLGIVINDVWSSTYSRRAFPTVITAIKCAAHRSSLKCHRQGPPAVPLGCEPHTCTFRSYPEWLQYAAWGWGPGLAASRTIWRAFKTTGSQLLLILLDPILQERICDFTSFWE